MGNIGLQAAGFSSYEDFVYNWHDRIGSQLIKLGVKYQDIDDRRQEVYFRIFKTGHLEKFDPSLSNFPSHIYVVCQSVSVNAWNRAQRRPLDLSISLVESMKEPEGFFHDFRSVRILELMVMEQSSYEEVMDARAKLEDLEKELRKGYLWSKKTQRIAVAKFGIEVENNLWQMAVWLYIDGWRVTDLADCLDVRHGSVSNWKKRLTESSRKILAA